MGTIALNKNWDIRIEPESVESTAFSPIVDYPLGTIQTMKITNGCDTISQNIKQNILSNDLSAFVGKNVNAEFVGGLIKSSILSVNGVIALLDFSIRRTNLSASTGGLSVSFVADTTCGQISSTIG